MTIDLSKLPQCPDHGRYVGRVCPFCNWPTSKQPEPKAESDTYDRTNWHRGPEKELHEWLEIEMIRLGVSYVHGRMDKESTIRRGWPDFSLFYTADDGVCRSCFVELKSKTTAILKDQVEVIAELKALNIPVLVTGNFTEAVQFIKTNLSIYQPTSGIE
jgi:hypothetical protein